MKNRMLGSPCCCGSTIVRSWMVPHKSHTVLSPFVFLAFVHREVGAIKCHGCSPSLVSSHKGHLCSQISTACAPKRPEISAKNSYPGLEEKDYSKIILNAISKARTGTTENKVLQALVRSEVCCRIKLSNHIINQMLKRFADDWKSALGFFRWASSHLSINLSTEAYEKMVDILGKAKQIDKMWNLVEEMHENGLLTLNSVAKMMRRLAGAGKSEEAIKAFDDLERWGIKKDANSMNILLDTLCKEKRVERAREVFLELKPDIPPNAYTFNIFIHGWCQARRIDEAHWTLLEMKGYGFRPCVIAYSTIIKAYCDQFNFRKVYELLDEMQAQGCSPNVVTYTSIMHSLAKSEEIDRALEIFERMKVGGCKLDTVFFNSLIHILGKAGRVNKAAQIFEIEMHRNGVSPNVSTYNTMISIFCRHSQEQHALSMLKEMESSISCIPDLLTYHPLLKFCFQAGKVDLLKKLLGDMQCKHHLSLDLGTYTLLVHGLCWIGECEWAYSLFCEMISQDITPRYMTCSLLLEEVEQRSMSESVDFMRTYMKHMKSHS